VASAAGAGAGSSRAAAAAHELLCALLRLGQLTGATWVSCSFPARPGPPFATPPARATRSRCCFPPYDGEALERVLCSAPPPRAAPDAEAAGADAALWRAFVASMMGVFGQSMPLAA
jgi:hypothetical protein